MFAVCLIASFLGAEFTNSLDFVKQYKVNVSEDTENDESQKTLSTGAATGSHTAAYMVMVLQAFSGDFDSAQKTAQSITDEEVQKTK